jgi:ADP-heptose:LPS heptosyltransferase
MLAAVLSEMTETVALPAGRFVVVHPGASAPERRWPTERFAAVADRLAECGLNVVLTGSVGEADITAAVREAMLAPCIDVTGRTSLGTLAALLSDAALLVSNDTGVMHVAEGTGTSLVAVSFDPERWRWAPLDAARYRVLTGGHDVMTDDVLEAATGLLCSRPGAQQPVASGPGQTPDAEIGGHWRR